MKQSHYVTVWFTKSYLKPHTAYFIRIQTNELLSRINKLKKKGFDSFKIED